MKINKLAIPLMLNSISSMVIGICDQAMVGRTYLEGFASVGIIGSNIYSITGILGVISVAFNILGSRAKGEDDYKQINNNLFFSMFFSIIIGSVFFALSMIFGANILDNFFNIHGDTLIDATIYLKIFSLSIGLNMILFNFSSYFKIINQTKYILYSSIISSVSNTMLDYVLIFGKLGFPKLGIAGNAIGSVMALGLGIVFYIIIIIKNNLFKSTKINMFSNAKEMMKISVPLALQDLVESTIIIFMMNYILSHIGLLEVSIYNLIFSIINIALMPMYAYSQAALNIVSEGIGAKDLNEIDKTVKACIRRALIFYMLICLIMLIFKNYIPKVITDDINLINNVPKYVFICIIANAVNVPSCVLKYSIQALGGEKFVFFVTSIISILSMMLIYIFVCILHYKFNSVYIGLMINYIALNLVFYRKFKYFKSNIEY